MVEAADPTKRAARTYADYEDPPAKKLVTTSRNATVPAWDEKTVATSTTTAAMSDAAELDKTFTDSRSLAHEILRLQDAHATPMTIIMRQSEWMQKAKAEHREAPTKPLDANATPAQIANAVVWLKIGGWIPRAELERDGGKTYIASIQDAVTSQPLVKKLTADPNEQAHRKYIGLDGRIGTEEQLVFYERAEALDAMYADSTPGSIAATMPNVVSPGGPPNVQRMRDLGKLGDAAEAALGHEAAATNAKKPAPHCNYPVR